MKKIKLNLYSLGWIDMVANEVEKIGEISLSLQEIQELYNNPETYCGEPRPYKKVYGISGFKGYVSRDMLEDYLSDNDVLNSSKEKSNEITRIL